VNDVNEVTLVEEWSPGKHTITIEGLGVLKVEKKTNLYRSRHGRRTYSIRWHVVDENGRCVEALCHQTGWASCGYTRRRQAKEAAETATKDLRDLSGRF
jgi:hypothetical protein